MQRDVGSHDLLPGDFIIRVNSLIKHANDSCCYFVISVNDADDDCKHVSVMICDNSLSTKLMFIDAQIQSKSRTTLTYTVWRST
jgi:hypothetical protein